MCSPTRGADRCRRCRFGLFWNWLRRWGNDNETASPGARSNTSAASTAVGGCAAFVNTRPRPTAQPAGGAECRCRAVPRGPAVRLCEGVGGWCQTLAGDVVTALAVELAVPAGVGVRRVRRALQLRDQIRPPRNGFLQRRDPDPPGAGPRRQADYRTWHGSANTANKIANHDDNSSGHQHSPHRPLMSQPPPGE